MVGKQKLKIVGLTILLLLCWIGFCPVTCRSAEIWSDDFNDGDFDGWTICENPAYNAGSEWTAAKYNLQLDQEERGIVSHPSSVAYGTWSFDFKANETYVDTDTKVAIYFINSNLDGDDMTDWTGYCIQFTTTTAGEGKNFGMSFRKNSHAVIPTLGSVLDSYETPVSAAGWHHINVTRTTAGLFRVYLNDSLVMEGEDTEYETSELFVFYACQWQMLDNIVVYDEILPPTEPIDWLTIVIIGASAVVIIAVLVIILKRR